MRELNPIGRDQDQLLMVSPDGERFYMHVDDALLKTLKDKKLNDAPGVELTPREIQDAIRAGKTVVELAESSGSSLDFIERFAHPVLEELGHMIDLAKAVRIDLPADRFNEITKKTFGEIVEGKLSTAGAKNISWNAKRSENSVWEISVVFDVADGTGGATWSFEPRTYLLTPETTSAQNLSNPGVAFTVSGAAKTSDSSSANETVVTEDKLQAFRRRREVSSEAQFTEVVVIPETPVANPEHEAEHLETGAENRETVQLTEPIPTNLGEESQEEIEKATLETVKEPPVTKKSRAPMPSWDEIVRGTQTDEGDSF